MKYLKMLALAAMACTALMAFASTASATTLKSGGTGGTVLKTGSTITGTLKSKTSATLSDTSGFIQNTCTSSTVSGTTSNETGTTVTGTITTLDFASCTRPTVTLKGGTLHVASIAGTDNGTVTGSGSEVETEVPGGGHCVYGTSTGTHLGTLVGATSSTGTASLSINAVLPLIKTVNGVCSSTAKWVAEYTVTTPVGLVVVS
jgi:hypothetical protein